MIIKYLQKGIEKQDKRAVVKMFETLFLLGFIKQEWFTMHNPHRPRKDWQTFLELQAEWFAKRYWEENE